MELEKQITSDISKGMSQLFGIQIDSNVIALQPTKKEFEGAYTFVTFPFAKDARKKPEDVAEAIGQYILTQNPTVVGYNVVKGFLNIVIKNETWIDVLAYRTTLDKVGQLPDKHEKVMVEYSSPNTNKPLHLGHLRNNFLGFSIASILEANGYDVLKVNLVNDRGIHICKSMIAYQLFGNHETPSTELKGDHLVGKYYVAFDKEYRSQISQLVEERKHLYPVLEGLSDLKDTLKAFEKEKENGQLTSEQEASIKAIQELYAYAEKNAPIMLAAQEMLRKWEAGDEETIALWNKLNNWVYDGFNQTYRVMGVSFDKMYKESDTYLLGKDIVEEGLTNGIFYKKDDGSVWIDLSKEGLDQKLVLRGDGTSVYITQDMGTADLKYQDFPMSQSIYVVGNEQDYHFKVLKLIMQKLGRPYADGVYHMSYGMVDLPSGKMKSREGTVVDADDLMQEMVDTARERTQEAGKIDTFSTEEAEKLYHMLAMGALKYYLLKVEPKKRMLFNPSESIDFQGDTGVYIQYTHAKICSLLRRAQADAIDYTPKSFLAAGTLDEIEIHLIQLLSRMEDKVAEAGKEYAPSIIASYAYELAKSYSKFYAEKPIFGIEDKTVQALRIALSDQVAKTLHRSLALLGISSPDRM